MSIIHHHFWLNNKESADFFTLQSGDRILLQDDQSFMESNEDLVVDPLTFGTPLYWLDASDASTLTDTTNSVDSWSSKSLAPQVFVGTTTSRPLTNTNTMNGLNVLTFDGSNDFLQYIYDSYTKTADYATEGKDNFTLAIVGRRNSDGVAVNMYSFKNNLSTLDGLAIGFRSNNRPRKFFGVDRDAASLTVTNGQTYSLVGRGNPGSYRVNNVEDNTALHPASPQRRRTRTVVGSSVVGSGSLAQFFNGDIAEIIHWNRALSESEMDSLYDDYLAPKWGL
jgi:hypothetical protein